MGKSHLISFAACLLLQTNPKGNIYIIYSSEMLMLKDKMLIDSVREIMGASKRIKTFVAGAKIVPTIDDTILIDECDEVYFSNLAWFESRLQKSTIIGFTATLPS